MMLQQSANNQDNRTNDESAAGGGGVGRDAVGKEGTELHDHHGDRTSKRSNDEELSKEGHEAVENEQGDNTVIAARLL